jgi:osmotically-inducible protein OsmY
VKTDAQIQQDVLRELKWDPRLEETDVEVEVNGGVVTLTGTVSSYAKRMAGQEAARRVAGVLDIANEIQVHVTGSHERTDTKLVRAVRPGLESGVVVPDPQIRSHVLYGCVTLESEVESCRERDAAEPPGARYPPSVKDVAAQLHFEQRA